MDLAWAIDRPLALPLPGSRRRAATLGAVSAESPGKNSALRMHTRSATRKLEGARGIHALPDELLTRVFEHLESTRDFGRADGVCRAWHKDGSPVEQALRLRIAARGDSVPAALPQASSTQQLCWLELRREARASSDLVSAGAKYASAAIDDEGQLCVFGNIHTLGYGGSEDIFRLSVPTPMTPPPDVRVRRVSVGGHHVLALTDSGAVLSFGCGRVGQLGHGDHDDQYEPKVIEALHSVCVVAISAGRDHSLVLTDDGVVLSFGRGGFGKLGHGDSLVRLEPTPIEALRGVRVVAIAAGEAHSLLLAHTGAVFSFGWGDGGQLGHGNQRDQSTPKMIKALLGVCVVAIAAGHKHSLVLTDEGAVLSFGIGDDGQLGHGDEPLDKRFQYKPRVIEALRGMRVLAVAAGGDHSLVLTDGGTVLSFGLGNHGQLGHGDGPSCKLLHTPRVVEALCDVRVVAITAGWGHSMALTEKGAVRAFGHAACGQLGHPKQPAYRDVGVDAEIAFNLVRHDIPMLRVTVGDCVNVPVHVDDEDIQV